MRMGKAIVLSLAGLLAGTGGAALAGSNPADLTVSASVANNCTISTSAVAFGAYDPISTHASGGVDLNNGAGKLTVRCTKSATSVSLALGNGNNFSGGARRMGSSGGDFLSYELYQPPSAVPATACAFPGSTVWNSTNALAPAAASFDGTAKDFFVCGSVPKGQNVGTGSYSDTVVATVNF
jgi:spore coat protein U domain-containing protein, fimbrial subunit CupE1/2/3/6